MQLELTTTIELFSGVPVPIVPLRMFKDLRGFCVLCAISALGGIAILAPDIVWPTGELFMLHCFAHPAFGNEILNMFEEVNTIFAGPTTTWQQSAWKTVCLSEAI